MTLTLVPEAIEAYAQSHSEPVDPIFEELRKETYAQMPMPHMQVGPLEGNFLKLLVRLVRAKNVFELGMFTGYSTLMMASALPEDGQITTCDIDPKAEQIARRFFAKSPHGRKIQIRMGPGLETIKTLQGPLDLVFIDADKENYLNYYEAVLPRVRSGGLIVADNTLWSGRVLEPTEESDRAIVAYNERVSKDTRVEKVLITLRDGMMLAYKK